MRRRRAVAAGLVACALLGLGACGGDADDTTATPVSADTVDKKDYIAQGDAVCAEIDQKVDAIPTPRPDAPPADALRFSEQLLAAVKPGYDRFKALKAPSTDKVTVDQLNSYLDQIAVKLNEEIAPPAHAAARPTTRPPARGHG